MRTFRGRLTFYIALLSVALLSAAGAFNYVLTSRQLRSGLDDALVGIAKSELASATDEDKVHVHDTIALPSTFAGRRGYEKYVWIEDQDDRVVAHTANVSPSEARRGSDDAEAQAWAGKSAFGNIQLGIVRLRAVYYPVRDPRFKPMVGIVGIPLEEVEQTEATLRAGTLGAVVIASLLSVAIAAIFGHSVTRPLRALATASARVEFNPFAEPMALKVEGQEFIDTVNAIDAMIARLNASVKEREDLIELQRQFVADASHELRTPIANIRGTSEVELRKSRTIEEYQEALQTIHRESERMTALVDDLMVLARTDLGQFSLNLESVNINELIEDAARMFSARASERNIFISVTGSIVFAQADRLRLRQVIDNLLDNAVRHALRCVEIQTRSTPESVEISIANDGPPVAESDLNRIFDRFYRGDRSRARSSGGTGLGLAIASSLVMAHLGRIAVENRDSLVVFTVLLPAPLG